MDLIHFLTFGSLYIVVLIIVLCFVTVVGLAVIVALFLGLLYVRFRIKGSRRSKDVSIGFFHPYCDAGGGGERVLWCALRALQRRFPDAHFVVYTGDMQSAPDQIIRRARNRFQIEFNDESTPEFVYLHARKWVEARTWPRFTLLGQSLGSLVLGYEALTKFQPDIFIDSMGYAFTLPLFKVFGNCKTACYVHYPTISTDMLDKVKSRKATYNNMSVVTSSRVLSNLKLIYYKVSF